MNETVWSPLVISASFDPSPAVAGQPTLLRVVVDWDRGKAA